MTNFFRNLFEAFEAVPNSLISLFARIGLFAPFFFSGISKSTQGADFPYNLQPNGSTLYQFKELFGLPFPEISAQMATAAEIILPVLLIVGFFTRFAALGLIIMVCVINYVDTQMAMDAGWYSWEEWEAVVKGIYSKHALWLAGLLILLKRGPGIFSVDYFFLKMSRIM